MSHHPKDAGSEGDFRPGFDHRVWQVGSYKIFRMARRMVFTLLPVFCASRPLVVWQGIQRIRPVIPRFEYFRAASSKA